MSTSRWPRTGRYPNGNEANCSCGWMPLTFSTIPASKTPATASIPAPFRRESRIQAWGKSPARRSPDVASSSAPDSLSEQNSGLVDTHQRRRYGAVFDILYVKALVFLPTGQADVGIMIGNDED